MRKGDLKKQEILSTAERLFCQKGFGETSVQDILDILKTSKGSFYHHFESKDQVLETLCTQRAVAAADAVREQLKKQHTPIEGLNLIIHGMTPIRREEAQFFAMLLPQLFTREGKALCVAYQEALRDEFEPILRSELEYASDENVICQPGNKDMTVILLELMNRCWLQTAEILLETIRQAAPVDPSMLLERLSVYRAAIERLLDAPYGSVTMADLQEWYEVCQLAERRINLPKMN